ncbi:Ran-binding protein-like protein [Clohesyomyces aquaticus]|uniref:Ran-binding protein-like protein n=1 Tax=Clohesyomyces aquaticus TaxID=1231657 RepID=A0A1Y2A229_9PLEO|nr:Ran-binding protein-like protein [Clohesyomyces aquaticus]
MFRRSSYASVAAGNASGSGQSQGFTPTRSGAFAHLMNANSASGPHAAHQAINHSRHHSRNADADGHHSSMSTSWGRAAPLPSYSSQFGYLNGFGGAGQDGPSSSSFFVPSYLRGSKYAERLEEAHKAKVAAQREYRSNHSSNAGSLSTSSSSVNLHKMVPSHRGLTHDIIERAPVTVDEPVAPWPTRWSDTDKYPQLDVLEDGRNAKLSGSSQKMNDEAASVRADYPIPRQCGIYYYEVTVVSKGKDGTIGVGFSGPKVPLSRIPGWEPDSFAYHGDDGQSFSNTTSGKPYGPKFGTLDVIGCGINFRTGTAFFTKNGVYIGVAFRDLKTDRLYYPTVGMKKSNETLRANFGQEPFAFDIDKMIEGEKALIHAEISKVRVSVQDKDKPRRDETSLVHELVSQYLAHDGYVETARAFADEVMEESRALAGDDSPEIDFMTPEEDHDAINRQRIRAAILDGDIDKALKHTQAYYPSVLHNNENIYFKLRCRKFIEMIRRCNELSAQCQQSHQPRSTASGTSNGNSAKRTSVATDEYDDFEMELDEQLGVHNNHPWTSSHNSTSASNTGIDIFDHPANMNIDTEDNDNDNSIPSNGNSLDIEGKQAKLTQLTDETIKYGMELKQEFAADPRREVKKALEDTFALIAYENVERSALAPLLEKKGRVPVSEELNGAILVSLGKSSSAALERLCQQTEALVNELAEDGGPGAFVNVKRDFLQ